MLVVFEAIRLDKNDLPKLKNLLVAYITGFDEFENLICENTFT